MAISIGMGYARMHDSAVRRAQLDAPHTLAATIT
jgi:hypothetical protein